MNIAELERTITALSNETTELISEQEDISSQLEQLDELEQEYSDLETEIQQKENAIKKGKKLFYEASRSLDTFTGDKFTDDFIKASYFASKEDVRPYLNYIKITGNQLIAIDGYRAIIIKNTNIPDELKNTFIKWHVRNNFKNYIEAPDDRYPDVIKIFEDIKKLNKKIAKVKASDFYSLLNVHDAKNQKGFTCDVAILDIKDIKMALNKEYLDIALMCFGDSEFDVYLSDSFSPIKLENENISEVVLPIKIMNGSGKYGK